MERKITDTIYYAGVKDTTLDLFEGQYPIPDGVTYNSYVIMDEQTVIMDTVDHRAAGEWLEKVKAVLGTKTPDYLVISHMEPDHGGSIQVLTEAYPQMKLVGNSKTFQMLEQFFTIDNLENRKVVVKEGDSLELGSHVLKFFMAPMVHWPEVMVTYEESEKVLFSADGFGTFGISPEEGEWIKDARRYYCNIVGKYGAPVQALLKKASALDIAVICPLHGPVLKENLGYYLEKYAIWSSYRPEEEGILIACASIHGHTKKAAEKLEELLKARGANVEFIDLTRTDLSRAVEAAFRYSKLVLAASTYDGGVFPPMEDFLHHLSAKALQNRKVALMENGSWAPLALKTMKGENIRQMEQLAEELLKD